jgi:dTDP-4-amino-4,6-dideoxygalactose transaminase
MIPFSPPRIDQKIIDEIIDTLKSGWITTGPKTKRFEKKLSEFYGAQSTLCISSATAGLELILRWFGVGEGDEVIVPVYTYCATANVVIHCGAKPVFVEVNHNDFNISAEALRNAITSKTKAVMPVDIAGMPCDYQQIYDLIREKEIQKLFQPANEIQTKLGRVLVLEDAAHSLGAVYKNRKIGSVADMTVFSFHAVKNLTTAEGGAIALNMPEPFNNHDIYSFLNILTLHGQNKDALAKSEKGAWKYDVVCAGYKANMTDILASIGLVEIDRYENDTLVKRKQIFDYYTRSLSRFEWAEIPVFHTSEKESSYHIFLLRIRAITETQRDQIIQLIFDHDVSVNVHFKPLPMFTFYASLGYDMKDFKIAYDNFSRVLTLPVYYDLKREDMEQVVRSVIESVNAILR